MTPVATRGARAALIAALMFAAGPSGAAGDAAVKRGREIAEAACADCHAIGATGTSPKAEAPLFRELGRKYPVESLEEALAEGVVVGHPGMPQVKMNEADIGAFIAHLKSIQVP
ncbi:c-type cytochrome [Pinisolibacter sp.]|uniref:c-type cytochrome n=1 Tax=Pinisolibacter sp. TaxID=2172024 RepID=UPI002FDD289E